MKNYRSPNNILARYRSGLDLVSVIVGAEESEAVLGDKLGYSLRPADRILNAYASNVPALLVVALVRGSRKAKLRCLGKNACSLVRVFKFAYRVDVIVCPIFRKRKISRLGKGNRRILVACADLKDSFYIGRFVGNRIILDNDRVFSSFGKLNVKIDRSFSGRVKCLDSAVFLKLNGLRAYRYGCRFRRCKQLYTNIP